jgi:hypothetical protein
MGRQRKRPSEYRFLLDLQPTLYALAIAFLKWTPLFRCAPNCLWRFFGSRVRGHSFDNAVKASH